MRSKTALFTLVALLASLVALSTVSAQAPPDHASLDATFSSFYAVDTFAVTGASDVDIDPATGYLWTTGPGRVRVTRPDGSLVFNVGSIGSAPGQLGLPQAVSIGGSEAFVADWGNQRISVFHTGTGDFVRVIDNDGAEPCAVHVDGGRLYVRSDASPGLTIYNAATGAGIGEVDGSASGTVYGSNNCDGNSIAGYGGEIYFSDAQNERVMVFDRSLNWQRDIVLGVAGGGLAITEDMVWVTEKFEDRVHRFAFDGTAIDLFDVSGSGDGEIGFPLGIEVNPTGTTFWLAENDNDRVQVFTRLRCGGELLTMVGTWADENLFGANGDDVIHLGEGNDEGYGYDGNDTICGGDGDDRLFGGDGNDSLRGQAGADRLDAEAGDDHLSGGLDDDIVIGGDGADTIFGGNGNDKMYGGQGADVMMGETGEDTIHGNRGADVLEGGDGDDRIFGYSENDTIDGGEGDDRLHGNFGDDVINGGPGNDRIFGYGDDDELDGDVGDDLIGGNFGDDIIFGGEGNDTLYGSADSDQVNGGAGNDIVQGSSGNDSLTGGSGNDALDGGIGTDTCAGNSGIDTATRCETVTGVP